MEHVEAAEHIFVVHEPKSDLHEKWIRSIRKAERRIVIKGVAAGLAGAMPVRFADARVGWNRECGDALSDLITMQCRNGRAGWRRRVTAPAAATGNRRSQC